MLKKIKAIIKCSFCILVSGEDPYELLEEMWFWTKYKETKWAYKVKEFLLLDWKR